MLKQNKLILFITVTMSFVFDDYFLIHGLFKR